MSACIQITRVAGSANAWSTNGLPPRGGRSCARFGDGGKGQSARPRILAPQRLGRIGERNRDGNQSLGRELALPPIVAALTSFSASVKSTLSFRLILCCSIFLVCATAARSQGEYQQTKDGKTLVWNGTAKPGETASWNGSRDSESYATGFGALTWYNANGKVYALYYGNMVRGKFEGAVNLHTNGRTAHAYFVDGGRVSTWARGPAPSKAPPTVQPVIEKRRAETEKAKAARIEAAKLATPVPETATTKTEPEKGRLIEEHVARKPAETPAETTPMSAEKEIEPSSAATPAQAFEEPATISTPAEERTEITSAPTAEPSVAAERENVPQSATREEPSVSSESTPAAPAASKSEADVSVSTLVGPPTSLRTTNEVSPLPENESSPPEHAGPLTEAEAVSLADTEARIHGFFLDDYERPRVDHSNVKGRWSLYYGLKDPSEKSADLVPFTVTVDDKTKKVEIRK
jgi:hypothetical protein